MYAYLIFIVRKTTLSITMHIFSFLWTSCKVFLLLFCLKKKVYWIKISPISNQYFLIRNIFICMNINLHWECKIQIVLQLQQQLFQVQIKFSSNKSYLNINIIFDILFVFDTKDHKNLATSANVIILQLIT